MCPKFNKLNEISCPWLRTALYMATGVMRERLEKEFSEFYTDSEAEIRVPASALRKKAREFAIQEEFLGEEAEFHEEMMWHEALVDLGIPIAFTWQEGADTTDTRPPAPKEVWDQLVGKKIQGGIQIKYMGESLTLVYFLSELKSQRILGGKIRRPILQPEYQFSFVLSRFIDLKS